MKFLKIVFAVFSICLYTLDLNAEIYSWTDENGVKHFSDSPPSTEVEYEIRDGEEQAEPEQEEKEGQKEGQKKGQKSHKPEEKSSYERLRLESSLMYGEDAFFHDSESGKPVGSLEDILSVFQSPSKREVRIYYLSNTCLEINGHQKTENYYEQILKIVGKRREHYLLKLKEEPAMPLP